MNAPMSLSKLRPFNEISTIIHQPHGAERVLATGCFDVLHRGHIELLRKAASLGHQLWVGINSDQAVRQLKGPTRPINREEDRAFLVENLDVVDHVFIIDSTTVTEAIRKVKPHVWVKGGDYTIQTLNKEEVEAAKEVGAEIVIVPTIGQYSTTKTLRQSCTT